MKLNPHKTQRRKAYPRMCVPRENLDQPAHSSSLIRIFTGGWGGGVGAVNNTKFLHAANEDYDQIAHALADLSLLRAHISE